MSIFDLFDKIASGKNAVKSSPEWLIVGLGNPGKKYELTRHNIGFIAVDTIGGKENVKIDKLKFGGVCAHCRVAGQPALLLKPQTFMNLSGRSVIEAARYYKIPHDKIIVVFDDATMELGKVRVRFDSRDGGHNGLKSIDNELATNLYFKVKIGVGVRPREYDLSDWVLSRFSEEEIKILAPSVDKAIDEIENIIKTTKKNEN